MTVVSVRFSIPMLRMTTWLLVAVALTVVSNVMSAARAQSTEVPTSATSVSGMDRGRWHVADSAETPPPDAPSLPRSPGVSGGAELALPPPSDRNQLPAPSATARRSPTVTVISSLAIVVGLFFLVVWVSRRATPQTATVLPTEVVQVLGRAPLTGRQMLHLVRVGNKVLVLAISPQGTESLAEITDAHEVERLCAACERNRPGSITATFRQVLQQFGQERTLPGFLGTDGSRELEFATPTQRD